MKKNELRKWRENYTPFNGASLGEGMKLNVHFDEKDFVKQNGGRWHPGTPGVDHGDGYWWMPTHMLVQKMGSNVPIVVNTFSPHKESIGTCVNTTMLDWLNNNKMLTNEAHGDLNDSACEAATAGSSGGIIYALRMGPENTLMQFIFFEEQNVVKVIGNGGTSWSHIADARALWNSLVETVDAKREKSAERYTHFSLDTQGA
jgi:hypothetical protein